MAHVSDLPCDGDGICMVCKHKAAEGEVLTCKTCATPWHVPCLTAGLKTLDDAAQWECPDCSSPCDADAVKTAAVCSGDGGGLVEKIRAIESDASLTDREKAKRRQELLSGSSNNEAKKSVVGNGGALGIFGDKFNCSICMQLLDRPVSTPCGHNFCLKCFQKWVGQQCKKTCAICRKAIPAKMASEPRINSAIVLAIRTAKLSQSGSSGGVLKVYNFIHNQDRPDEAFTTERAKKSGKANACSGKIFVTVPLDYFGPITAENDPKRNLGVMVGETWVDRMECRQWGAHFLHVAGICGQSDHGAQSVALSGGYEDDEDHGDWFLYTGSGGRDLSGNKRTNKEHSFDQTFTRSNQALRVSCREGYPVRVVRSHKEKRSCYAPPEGVRYDGVYRIEKCWRKAGPQGFKVCRYLFVRCDNEPAPWTSDTQGDRPRSSLPRVAELKNATDISERKGSPAWDYDEEQGQWVWKKPQPESRKPPAEYKPSGDYNCEGGENIKRIKIQKPKRFLKEKLLKEFSCLICRKVMVLPLTTPCAHNFCKACLEGAFAGLSFLKERTRGGRTLRTQKNVMKCPSCTNDLSDFLQNPQVNRELMNVIESLENEMKEEMNEMEEKSCETEGCENGSAVEDGDVKDTGSMDVDMPEASDGIDENSNTVAEEKTKCDVNAEIVKAEEKTKCDVNAEIVKAEEKTKCDVNAEIVKAEEKMKCDVKVEIAKVEVKTKCDVNAEIVKADNGSAEEPVQTAKPKRSYSTRKKADGEGAAELASNAGKTRRGKKTV